MQFVSLIALAASVSALTASDYLWPLPNQVVDKKSSVAIGGFAVTSNILNVATDPAVASLVGSFTAKGGKVGKKFPVTANVVSNNGWSVSGPEDLPKADESYTLDITATGATISANSKVGVQYGLQTLSQLITADGKLVLATVNDKPAFPYRGFMLDTARNFFPVEDIKRIIDGLAAAKLNVFHWHIFDSQSFPIEWKTYPQVHKNAAYKNADGSFKIYTQTDIQGIVQYAFDRNIRVIPEFETPGHNAVLGWIDQNIVSSWNHSPWDGNSFATNAMCSNQTVPVNKETNDCVGGVVWWGRNYCNQPPCGQLDVRQEKALQILDQLINEVGSWFKDPVIHMGHDEINTRAYGLVPDNYDSFDSTALLTPMMRNFDARLQNMLGGKTLGAWDEVAWAYGVDDIIKKDSLITVWTGPVADTVNNAAAKGFTNIVLAPSDYYYFDCSPSAHWCSSDFERNNPPTAYNLDGFKTFAGQWHNWTLIYDYDPLAGLTDKAKATVKGGFGALWSETVKRHNLDRYVFPRIAAVAERYWSNIARNDNTATRLDRFRASLINEKGIASADLSYLGNGENFVFRPEYCDNNSSPGQKTAECCFPGQPLTAADGSGLVAPYGSHFTPSSGYSDYCKSATLYKTNDFKYVKPAPVKYQY
ncbi:N-acetyl-glucosamine-6-phosphate deacetylase [Rhizoclosmatium sp. JEL0117]|nr:N-acetyl-glucosamine-6-phosphate deacetylase [Rhizoclosmatium sp. JEL0117]